MLEVVEEVFGGETYWDPATPAGGYKEVNPSSVRLEQNYPNPASNSTRIDFTIQERTHIELTVYNALGSKISELINKEMDPGSYSTILDAGNLANGPYICVLKAGHFVEVRKFVILK
jgi:hypothetical protein